MNETEIDMNETEIDMNETETETKVDETETEIFCEQIRARGQVWGLSKQVVQRHDLL